MSRTTKDSRKHRDTVIEVVRVGDAAFDLLLNHEVYRANAPQSALPEWLWCWRCKTEMPMLDEVEYLEVYRLYGEGMSATKEFRQKWGIPLEGMEREVRFKPLLDRYEQMTGMRETNPNAVMHHRLALYGPPCRRCGKPLRTPKARLCGSCMARRAESSN